MPIKGAFGAASARAFRLLSGAFTSFSDNFNRTTSGELGTSSSGGAWKALTGIWSANGSSATTATSASSYPIANIEMASPDITASISTGSGSTLISTTGTIGSISAGDGTTGQSGFYWATITDMSSTTGLAVGDWISATSGTGTIYGGTPDYVEVTSIVSSSSITYRTKGGTTPTAGTVTNISTRSNDGGSGIALWTTDSGNWWGISYGRTIDTSCNCSSCSDSYCNTYTNYSSSYCGGYSNYGSSYSPCGTYAYQAGFACTTWNSSQSWNCTSTSYSYSCLKWAPGSTGYFCPSGYSSGLACSSWSSQSNCGAWRQNYAYNGTFKTYKTTGYSCTGYFTSWSCTGQSSYYSCPSGYASYTNADTCIGGYGWVANCGSWLSSYTDYCSAGYNFTNLTCAGYVTYTAYAPSCSGGTYTAYAPACSGTTYGYVACNCQTCYPPYISVVKSASNAVSEVTRWSLSSMAGAIKVITNSVTKVITIRPYKDKEMTTQIGSDLTYTATDATINNKFGIILTPSDNVQGTNVDDFNININ